MAESKINGVEYSVAPLQGVAGYTLLTRLLAIAGEGAQFLPVIARSAIEDATQDKADDFLTNATLLAASTKMIKEAGVQEIVQFRQDVIELAEVKAPSGEYREVSMDADFQGNLSQAEDLFNFVIKVQFSDFSKGSAASGQVALAIMLIKAVFQSQR